MTDSEIKKLVNLALKERENAYCPYSCFPVGAALLAEDGEIFAGCNMENNSYGASLCAERNAIGSAVAAGKRKFKALAVAGSSKDYTTPCGICRQVICEFQIPLVICVKNTGEYEVKKSEDLLPEAFFEKTLLNKRS